MFKTLVSAFKIKDLRKKLLITLLLLFVYRIGCWLTVPGISPGALQEQVSGTTGITFLSLLNSISGGALANASFFALGVSPYISASIIVQLIAMAFPDMLKNDNKQKKINFLNRIVALILALAQSIGIVVSFANSGDFLDTRMLGASVPEWVTCAFIVIMLVSGAMFTVWMGEKITSIGVGNGLSLLIFVGILSTACTGLYTAAQGVAQNIDYLWTILIFLLAVVVIFSLIILIDNAERRIVYHAAGYTRDSRFSRPSSYYPMKVNSTGVIPIIFANSRVSFPQMLISIFWPNSDFAVWWTNYLGTNSWVYIVVSALLILFLTVVYGAMMFKEQNPSEFFQKNNLTINMFHHGKQTADYLNRINSRLNWFCGIYLAFIALVPSLVFNALAKTSLDTTLINAFSVTGLMILVSVALEFEKQLEQQVARRTENRGFLKRIKI